MVGDRHPCVVLTCAPRAIASLSSFELPLKFSFLWRVDEPSWRLSVDFDSRESSIHIALHGGQSTIQRWIVLER